MAIGMGDVASGFVLLAIGALAWFLYQNSQASYF